MRRPWIGGSPNVNGIRRAHPIVAVRPGRAPTIIPDVIPTKTKKKFAGFSITVENALNSKSKSIFQLSQFESVQKILKK
jgi:hypothetical protein